MSAKPRENPLPTHTSEGSEREIPDRSDRSHRSHHSRAEPAPRNGAHHAAGAARYWAANLDPQNLERESQSSPAIPLNEEIIFASTPDVEAARHWLLRSRRAPGCIADLGAGLGAISFVFARRGTWVLSVDTSLERLKKLRHRAEAAGCADLISPIVADAQALPFADASLPALFTKSVLIHTDVPHAAAEAARVLSEGGRAAFIEPQPGNPFAWLYRNTLAPKAWKEITRYFSADTQATCIRAVGQGLIKPFYLFSFFAFAFQFAWPNLRRFSRALAVLHHFDQWIFSRFRWTHRFAWFGLIEAEKPEGNDLPPGLRRRS